MIKKVTLLLVAIQDCSPEEREYFVAQFKRKGQKPPETPFPCAVVTFADGTHEYLIMGEAFDVAKKRKA